MNVHEDVSGRGGQEQNKNRKKEDAASASSSVLKLTIQPKQPKIKPKSKLGLNPFNNDDDDESDGQEQDNSNNKSKLQSISDKNKPKSSSITIPNFTTKLSRQQKMAQEEATKLDATIFEYDQVYDLMKSAENKVKSEKESQGTQRKPQYISGLIETAKQRKIDRVRAEDKMVQREREAEGEVFANKDEFVTPAYLQQQKELREAEEAEKLKQETGPNKKTMTTFYQNILEENSKRHEAAVSAVASAVATLNKPKPSNSASLGISATLSKIAPDSSQPIPAQYDPEPEAVPSEAKLAAEMGKKLGRKVDLDDEGRIVDHRQLLTGGLNLGPPKLGLSKPKKIGFALPIADRKAQAEKELIESENSRKEEESDDEGLTQLEKLKLSRERQSILLQQQLIALEDKKRKSEEDSRLENIKRVAKRNDVSKIELLKQQALKRRQERQEALKESH